MPRPALTSSFALSDASNEVVCPLKNNDGSNCRKRCLGEKRFRSMQEHIRRAHPSHYIPKLPATEESFMLMVNSQRPDDPSPRPIDEAHPAATAAVALAQLHHHRLASDWGDEDAADRDRMRSSVELPPLRDHFKHENFASPRPRELLPSILARSPPPRSSTLPPIQRRDRFARPRKSSITQNARKPKHESPRPQSSRDYPQTHAHPHHHPHHPRRPSLGERKALSAEPQTAAWAQGKRWEDLIEAATSATEVDDDRSVDAAPLPPLIANITSAPFDPSQPQHQPQTQNHNRASLPPLHPSHNRSLPPPYTASPLHKSLTPPPFDSRLRGRDSDLEPFPSIESSLDSASSASGKHFPVSRNLAPSVHSDSSPMYPPSSSQHHHHHQRPGGPHRFSNPGPGPGPRNREIHISCANCARPSALDDCFACTECICGVCRDCVGFVSGSPSLQFSGSPRQPGGGGGGSLNGLMSGGPGSGGPTSHPQASPGQASAASVASSSPGRCPRCRTVGGKWKAFQLEFR